jgi:hypothetical protein
LAQPSNILVNQTPYTVRASATLIWADVGKVSGAQRRRLRTPGFSAVFLALPLDYLNGQVIYIGCGVLAPM